MPSWGPTRWGGACAVKRFGEAKTLKSAEFTSDDLSKITGLPHGAQRWVGLAWARSWRSAQRNISRTSKCEYLLSPGWDNEKQLGGYIL